MRQVRCEAVKLQRQTVAMGREEQKDAPTRLVLRSRQQITKAIRVWQAEGAVLTKEQEAFGADGLGIGWVVDLLSSGEG